MDVLLLPGASAQSLAAEASFMLALKLFEVGRLSSGKAGQLCGVAAGANMQRFSRSGNTDGFLAASTVFPAHPGLS